MRDFRPPIAPELEQQLRTEVIALFEQMPNKKQVRAVDYAMDDGEMVVIHAADIKLENGERFRLATTTPEARPPFEWQYEITSEIDEGEYFKHYLVREHDVVLAQRKLLTPIDDEEARSILADFAKVRAALAEGLS